LSGITETDVYLFAVLLLWQSPNIPGIVIGVTKLYIIYLYGGKSKTD